MKFVSPDNEYPRHPGDIQLIHKNWKPGDELPEGWVEVADAPMPKPKEGEVAFEDFPFEVDGVMTQNWQVRPMTDEEIEAKNAAETSRDKLIELGLSEAEITDLLIKLVR